MVAQPGVTAPINVFTMDKHTDINLTAIVETWLVPAHKAPFAEGMSTSLVAQVWCGTCCHYSVFLPSHALQPGDLLLRGSPRCHSMCCHFLNHIVRHYLLHVDVYQQLLYCFDTGQWQVVIESRAPVLHLKILSDDSKQCIISPPNEVDGTDHYSDWCLEPTPWTASY
jgi:hypothetical protein